MDPRVKNLLLKFTNTFEDMTRRFPEQKPENANNYHRKLKSKLHVNGRLPVVLKRIESLEEPCEKIKYTITLLNENDLIPKVTLRQPKNDVKSTEFRKSGNQCFVNKKYFDALELYNKSICFAQSGTENLSIGYANRSAVYFEWQLYDSCLENIRLAKEAKYPARLMPKLEKRSVECHDRKNAKKTKKPELRVPKLSYAAHPNIPYMADCLDLVDNKQFGRHVIATRNLNVGEIVVMEDPLEIGVMSNNKYQRCANCLIENDLSLIPCPNCTSAMYCSPDCLATAHEKFHKYECPIIDALFDMFDDFWYTAARVMLTLLHEYKTMEEVAIMAQEMDDKKKTIFTSAVIDRKRMYKAFHMLASNIDHLSNSDMFQCSTIVGITYNLFMENTDLQHLLEKDSHKNVFLNLLFRYSQIAKTNLHSLEALTRIDDAGEIQTKPFGFGAYLVGSLFNHSCSPNISRNFYQTSKNAVMTSRPIKTGEQLFDCYGQSYMRLPKYARQTELKHHYQFNCTCEACINDYPMIEEMKDHPALTYCVEPTIQDQLKFFDFRTAMYNFKTYKKYLEKNDRYHPSLQVCAAQGALDRSFRTCFANISLKIKE